MEAKALLVRVNKAACNSIELALRHNVDTDHLEEGMPLYFARVTSSHFYYPIIQCHLVDTHLLKYHFMP